MHVHICVEKMDGYSSSTGQKNSKSHSGPITVVFEDQFHAWTAVLLLHHHH